MTPPSNGQALGLELGSRSRGVDLLYWCRPDMEGRIPGMEALVTPHHVVDLAQLLGAT
jgi:hypothetical protein